MGIKDLFKICKNITVDFDLNKLRGETVVLDGNIYIHKSKYKCVFELSHNIETQIIIHEFMSYVKSLLGFGIKLMVVFDGNHAPIKKETHFKRQQ